MSGTVREQIANANLPLTPLTNLHIHAVARATPVCDEEVMAWRVPSHPTLSRNVYSPFHNLLAKHWSQAGWAMLSGSVAALFLPESKYSALSSGNLAL